MRSLLRTAVLAVLLGSAVPRAAAQADPISRTPVTDAITARDRLFSLPAGDSNFFFRTDLPGDDFLLIRFNRLGTWQPGTLPDMVAAAQQAWAGVRDSLRSPTATRRLAVHLPPSGYPAIVAYREWGAESPTLLLKNGSAQPLRIASDTLVLLKTLPATGATPAPQIEYTFLLKDLGDIDDLAAAPALLDNISQKFDSLVAATARRWKRPDAEYHQLSAQYDVRNGIGPAAGFRSFRRGSLYDRFEYGSDLGASVLSGILVNTAVLRESYYFNAREARARQKNYVAVSLSALNLISVVSRDELVIRSLSFLNVELGALYGSVFDDLPLYRTGLGVGYRISDYNAGPYDFRYRLFFNYSVSKALTIVPEFYSNFKKQGEGGIGAYGLGVSLKLF